MVVMFVIADRINGIFSDVNEAIESQDAAAIQAMAKELIEKGATALDINAGRKAKDPQATLLWLAESIRQVSDVPLSIDTARPAIMKAVVSQVPGKKIINSTKADPEMAIEYIGLAVENEASLIGLTIDVDGVPGNVEKRVELGAQLIALATDAGLDMSRLFIDPIMLPLKVTPQNPVHCLRAVAQLKEFSDPPPHLLLGLSNVSDGCASFNLIDRTYVAMAIAHGLDSVFADTRDTELMDSIITAELLLGKMVYCDSYLEAARQSQV
jgi:5-methyltetrahydrofolate corrinoid/iron sulfur protein methyltransferase